MRGYVNSIHETLVLGCNTSPNHNYKGGVFSNIITFEVPVLSCLGRLIESALTTTAEKTVFAVQRNAIVELLGLEVKQGPLSFQDIMKFGRISFELIDIFKRDMRDRGLRSPPDEVGHPPLSKYNGSPENIVSLLLQTTQITLELACSSPTGYKGGIFQNIITANMHLTDALQLLSHDSHITTEEKAIFAKAVVEARKLYDLKLTNQKITQPPGGMYVTHMAWFNPMLEVFDRDFERRTAKSKSDDGIRS
ncbi:hypothetical protein MMC32_005476 [Xylographa parallela]|nr:hypothetical protein [Xylographa parallela]